MMMISVLTDQYAFFSDSDPQQDPDTDPSLIDWKTLQDTQPSDALDDSRRLRLIWRFPCYFSTLTEANGTKLTFYPQVSDQRTRFAITKH